MRTTVSINDRLLAEAKVVAAQTHRPLGSILDDALHVLLVQRSVARPSTSVLSLPTGGGTGFRPGVNLEDKEQLAELLGDNGNVSGNAHS